jgi:hypothetical protein
MEFADSGIEERTKGGKVRDSQTALKRVLTTILSKPELTDRDVLDMQVLLGSYWDQLGVSELDVLIQLQETDGENYDPTYNVVYLNDQRRRE